MKTKKSIRLLALVAGCVFLMGCTSAMTSTGQEGKATGAPATTTEAVTGTAQTDAGTTQEEAGTEHTQEEEPMKEGDKIAVIEVEDFGTITVALDASAAPETVKNFVALAESGFYNGLTFHRIMDGFMMQGGDPTGTGFGGSDNNIKGEFAANGVQNPLSHTRGTISMARSQDMDSASSQFFICHQDALFLDGNYAAFGHVTDGMDVVDRICTEAQPVDNNGTIPPENQPVMTSVVIQ